jgi:transcriptional regulator with PAS, ATPase and Fis domain
MLELFSMLPLVAESRSTVLIEGKSGTGKELIAKAIHNQGPKPESPFLAVNCGALPDTLIEAELFGYKSGAFTDAKRDKQGLFEAAGDGTIMLDEIGDVSAAMQIRLLRVLQHRTFTPLGSTKSLTMRARVIAATHCNLRRMVSDRQFREDLFFRVNVIRLRLPPLGERKEDIPLLVNHFVERFNTLTGKKILRVSDGVLAALALYDWPGNIRELENAIEHAFILCRGSTIRMPHLPDTIRPRTARAVSGKGRTLRDMEKRAVKRALDRNNWRRLATARELGIDKNTLRRKIQRYGIEPDR